MKIKCIKLDGYRNLHNVVLKPNDFCSLIGLNNYGKSNLLHAIVYGISFLKVRNNEKEKMMKCISEIPINKKLYKLNFLWNWNCPLQKKKARNLLKLNILLVIHGLKKTRLEIL